MHQTPAGTLGVHELYVLGATLECGFSSRWGSCSLGAYVRLLSHYHVTNPVIHTADLNIIF